MTDEPRPEGWYEDPWGTEAERYFDGGAWTRRTRPVGGEEAGSVAGSWPVPVAGTAMDPGPAVPGLPDAAPASPVPPAGAEPAPARHDADVPAGWHPDPWGLAAMRWWDGSQWTGHVSGPPAALARPVDVEGERALARWTRPALLAGGAAYAVSLLASVDQARWVVDNWSALTTAGSRVPDPPSGTFSSFASVASIVSIVVGVLFLLWFYRAASTGWSSGIPARRGPAMATLSFVIPVINLWWPYQAAIDMVPADDAHRRVIRWWWALWLTGTLCGLLVYPVTAAFDSTVARGVAVVGAAAIVAAAFAGRAVVELVTRAHETMLGAR